MIVSGSLDPKIREMVYYLRKQGVDITYVTYTHYKTETGEVLLSTDTVVGLEPPGAPPTPRMSPSVFIQTLVSDRIKSVAKEFLQYLNENEAVFSWRAGDFETKISDRQWIGSYPARRSPHFNAWCELACT